MIRLDRQIQKALALQAREFFIVPNEWYISEDDLLELTVDGTVTTELLLDLYSSHVEQGDSFILRSGHHLVCEGRESGEHGKVLQLTFGVVS